MRLVAFRKLWMSSAFEGVGDEPSRVVIPIIAVSMLGAGALEVGMLNALGLSAFLVLGVPIGVWVDRLRRRRLMIAADVFRALVVLSVPAAFVAGAMTIGHLLVCVALVSVADVVFTTAHGAFVRSVVHREQVSDAHARLQSAASMVAVGSPSLTAAAASVAAPAILKQLGIGRTRILAVACVPVVALTPLAAVLPWFPALWLGASTFGWAFLVVVISVAGAGIVPRIAPAHRLGIVMASSRLFVLGIMPLASLTGGALAAWIGVQPVLWTWALLAGASVVPIVFSPLRTWRELPAGSDADADSDAAGHAVTD